MPRVDIDAQVIRNEILSRNIFHLTLSASEIARNAKPGQFCMLSVNDKLRLDPLLRRPFSIFDVGTGGEIDFLYSVAGRGTNILSQKKKDDYVRVMGPLGRGFGSGQGEHAILVGGGMGAAPLHFLAKGLKNGFSVVLGAKTKDELPVVPAFKALTTRLMIATEDGSLDRMGLVTAPLEEELAALTGGGTAAAGCLIYACGPWPMMRAVHQIAAKFGIRCEASLETKMACGIGVCLGCAVKKAEGGYIHVCKDGPVVDSRQIDWEARM